MGIITLITDFGWQDEYVGLMKGVMLGIDPAARFIDLTHAIDPQDVAQAAFGVESSWRYFPEGTIHAVIAAKHRSEVAQVGRGPVELPAREHSDGGSIVTKLGHLIKRNSRHFNGRH